MTPRPFDPKQWAAATELIAVRCLQDLAEAVAEITNATGVRVRLEVYRAAHIPSAPAAMLPPRIEVDVGDSVISGENVSAILAQAPRHRQDIFNRIQRARDYVTQLEAEAGISAGKAFP